MSNILDYGPEAIVINKENGNQLRTQPYPAEVDYVRVCNSEGEEIAYWTMDEVIEDPADVLGAMMGALIGGRLK